MTRPFLVVGALLTVLQLGNLVGCGEVYASLEVVRQASADSVAFTPNVVAPNTLELVTVKVRLDGEGTAWVDSTSLDGTDGIAMAFPSLGFSPGACPENVDEVTVEVAEDIASGSSDTAIDEQGRYVFCGAIQVGDAASGSVVTVDFVFWNGLETVDGSADLAVVEAL